KEAEKQRSREEGKSGKARWALRCGSVAAIPPLRGPTRHTLARKKNSGRSGRDDSFAEGRVVAKAAASRRSPKEGPREPGPTGTVHRDAERFIAQKSCDGKE